MWYNNTMAQYKVPQDVEADDKLIGPFSFRQFVYLLIAGGLIALAVALFQIFPLLAIIPVPFILLLGALALPLKKDQPMETYLAAIVSYYLKPRTRRWTPGQKESTITITAPKKQEAARTRDITGEEATHRLSFLADIVDTEGYAIKGAGMNRVNEELVAEANMTNDMFETHHFDSLGNTIAMDENRRYAKVVQEMHDAIKEQGDTYGDENESRADREDRRVREEEEVVSSREPEREPASIQELDFDVDGFNKEGFNYDPAVIVMPGSAVQDEGRERSNVVQKREEENDGQIMAKPSIIELANNPDFSVATISKEAKRIKERDEGEVFISLH